MKYFLFLFLIAGAGLASVWWLRARDEQKLLTKRYTENTEAYQLYLKGRYYLNKRTADGYQKGIDHFQQAIEKDPNYALAYTGLADSYMWLAGSVQCRRKNQWQKQGPRLRGLWK